jgi:microcystin-dependent protein
VSNTYAPVTGGRTGNPATDFAANKPIKLCSVLGRALAAAGAGAGLTPRSLGQNFGEEAHTMTLGELVPHTHSYNQLQVLGSGPAAGGSGTSNQGSTTGSAGSGTPFNVMQPTFFINWMAKL